MPGIFVTMDYLYPGCSIRQGLVNEEYRMKTESLVFRLFGQSALAVVLLAITLAFSFDGHAQDWLPPFVDFTHDDGDTLTWADKQGVHFLVLHQSEKTFHESEMTSSQYILAKHWLQEGNSRVETWSYQDGIEDCQVDIEAKFLAAPRFADLDEDGVYEVWFITQMACKGDISPSRVQVVMVDNGTTYRMDAEEKLVFPDGTTDGGSYTLGDFEQLPELYQTYAREYLYRNYVFEYGKDR